MTRIAVALETSPRKTFATAVDWPGWSRSGKTREAALEALLAYADRYRPVAELANVVFPAGDLELEVTETSEGGAGTEFGVPSRVTEADRRRTTTADGEHLAALLEAAWTTLDRTVAASPESLRKGPRGGGRDTSRIVEHTLASDHAYARELGLKLPAPVDAASIRALRGAILDVLRPPTDGSPLAGRRWTARYAAHRIAWHSLDHAWEIEDRRDA